MVISKWENNLNTLIFKTECSDLNCLGKTCNVHCIWQLVNYRNCLTVMKNNQKEFMNCEP